MNLIELSTGFAPFVVKALNKGTLQTLFNLRSFIKEQVDKDSAIIDNLSDNQYANLCTNIEQLEHIDSDYATGCKLYKNQHKEDFVPYVRGSAAAQPSKRLDRKELADRLAKLNRDEHKDVRSEQEQATLAKNVDELKTANT